MANSCRFRKKNGEICRANAQSENGLCIFHDPTRAREGRRARRNGGKRRSQTAAVLHPGAPDHPIENSKDVVRLLAETINQVRRGQLDPRVANAIGYLSNIVVATLQHGPLEDRLSRLEASVEIAGTEPRETSAVVSAPPEGPDTRR